mgnify:FL=1
MTLYASRNNVKLFILSNGEFSLKVYENGRVEYNYKFNSEELEVALTAWAMYQLDDPFWINYVKDFGVDVLEFPILKRLLIV